MYIVDRLDKDFISIYFNRQFLKLVIGNSRLFPDPVQVIGDTGVPRWPRFTAAGSEHDDAHLDGVVVCDQCSAGVASTHRLSIGSPGAHIGGGHRSIGPLTLAIADDLYVHALHPVGQLSIAQTSPTAGHAPPVLEPLPLLAKLGQRHLVDQVGEAHVGRLYQSDVMTSAVSKSRVKDKLILVHRMLDLTVPG